MKNEDGNSFHAWLNDISHYLPTLCALPTFAQSPMELGFDFGNPPQFGTRNETRRVNPIATQRQQSGGRYSDCGAGLYRLLRRRRCLPHSFLRIC